jgi:hypothetical protein
MIPSPSPSPMSQQSPIMIIIPITLIPTPPPRQLVRVEGLASIYKGMPAILAKQLPYTIVQLCGFELLTHLLYS